MRNDYIILPLFPLTLCLCFLIEVFVFKGWVVRLIQQILEYCLVWRVPPVKGLPPSCFFTHTYYMLFINSHLLPRSFLQEMTEAMAIQVIIHVNLFTALQKLFFLCKKISFDLITFLLRWFLSQRTLHLLAVNFLASRYIFSNFNCCFFH